MLTRCPSCTTTFKVTPEQLKARAGKVRCGKCQSVFNALDSLVEVPAAAPAAPPPPAEPVHTPSETVSAPQPDITLQPAPTAAIDNPATPDAGAAPELASTESAPAAQASDDAATQATAEETDAQAQTPEAVRDAAVAVGLVAARETTEIPGYNKWAEGAFTAPVSLDAATDRPVWPFVLVALMLILALLGQAAHQFRAELAVSSPALRPLLESLCSTLGCDIPLPRHAELVSIEASDLQIDPAHGGALMLAATLKNRAGYAQAWPQLEITLTDVQDQAVLRRVLQPGEYLPAKADPTIFPPNGEIGLKLWLEAKDVAAAGYRLYVFYP